MLVKHHSQGKFYLIVCPEGSRVIRRSDRIDQLITGSSWQRRP